MEKTLRLTAPWELPITPQLDSAEASASEVGLDAETPSETIVLELPWAEESEPRQDASALQIRSVDRFEDPWAEERGSRLGAPELVNPWGKSDASVTPEESPSTSLDARELKSLASAAASLNEENRPSYPSVDLVDPWAD